MDLDLPSITLACDLEPGKKEGRSDEGRNIRQNRPLIELFISLFLSFLSGPLPEEGFVVYELKHYPEDTETYVVAVPMRKEQKLP